MVTKLCRITSKVIRESSCNQPYRCAAALAIQEHCGLHPNGNPKATVRVAYKDDGVAVEFYQFGGPARATVTLGRRISRWIFNFDSKRKRGSRTINFRVRIPEWALKT